MLRVPAIYRPAEMLSRHMEIPDEKAAHRRGLCRHDRFTGIGPII
jgi:hypothetical protein